jgi:hypothetical protein
MNQTCDRCGPAVCADYRVDREGALYFCRHCTSRLWTALSAQGWAIWPIGAHATQRGLAPSVPNARRRPQI